MYSVGNEIQGGTLRTAIQFEVGGIRLQGTYHYQDGCQTDPSRIEAAGKRVGILFSNAGYQPRSSQGDLAAHLADYTSELGFPSFRFDMPGVGDSEGDLPAEVLEYYELVQNGGHVAFVSDLKAALVQKYGLNGMIYLGHCGSATTGVYAAVQHPSADLLGLILLDPSFIWYRASGQGAQQMKKSSSLSFKEKLISLRLSLRAWLIQKPGGEYLTLLYSQLELLCHRILGRKRVPLDCNRKLLECYRILLSRNIPILVLTAPHVQKHFSQFDYADYLQSNYGRNSLTVVKIAGASHSFLEGNGRQAVSSAVDAWLSAHFRA